MNPVFILDEIDKLQRRKFNIFFLRLLFLFVLINFFDIFYFFLNTKSYGIDPYYSLLEILNPEENSNFVDHYLDIKVDFS